MSYIKKWAPPTIPFAGDLAVWKTLFNDLHENLLLSGLVQTATPGQLVIDDVATLPADGTYAGFIEYALTDAMQTEAPVTIRIQYGCGNEGLYDPSLGNQGRTPRVLVKIYFRGQLLTEYGCPQTLNTYTSFGVGKTATTKGVSYICNSEERGFLGVAYGVGSRNKPMNHANGGYHAATLILFIQRTTNADGVPTNVGVGIFHPSLTANSTANLWTAGILPLSKSVYSSGDAATIRTDMAPRVGREGFAGGIDSILFEPIFYPSVPAKPFPYLYSYRANLMGVNEEFTMDTLAGPSLNFVSLGNETGLSIDSVDGQRAGVVMLFE